MAVWAKQAINLEKFISEEHKELGDGLVMTQVRPAIRRELTALVTGLPFTTPDSQVIHYFESFGAKVVSKEAKYGVFKEGPWKNQYNGDRMFKVDFSSLKCPMGTYHLLRGSKIKIFYPGNLKTCGRCHLPPAACVGGGVAAECVVQAGPRVSLMDHMRQLWAKVSFVPGNTDEAEFVEENVEDPIPQDEEAEESPISNGNEVANNVDENQADVVLDDVPIEAFTEELSVDTGGSNTDPNTLSPASSQSTSTSSPSATADPAPSSDFPSIQEKVDKFETDKRKAETSPDMSKKEKKKLKNIEKAQRKLEHQEKIQIKFAE